MVPRFTVAKRICADERSSSQLVVNPEFIPAAIPLGNRLNCRKIAITLIDRVVSVIA